MYIVNYDLVKKEVIWNDKCMHAAARLLARATSFTRFRSTWTVSYLKRMAAITSILEIEKMYYKNIKEFTEQKPEFELKFGFEPGSVMFEKILKFAKPWTGIKVQFGPLPELWTEL